MLDSLPISVIMPVYNGARFLRESIDSILNQSFDNFELIIIDDGSTDCSNEIIESYLDRRIVHLKNASNKGIVHSLNKGLFHARGSFIARMDSDDISNLDRLRIQFDYLISHPDVALCGSWFRILNKKQVVQTPVDDFDLRIRALISNPIAHPTVMMRKSILSQNNLRYNKRFLHVEDYALWLEMLELARCVNIPQVLLEYRIHATQISSTQYNIQVENFHKLRRQYLSKYLLNKFNINLIVINSCSTIAEHSHYYRQLLNSKSFFLRQHDSVHLDVVKKELDLYQYFVFNNIKFQTFDVLLTLIRNQPSLFTFNFMRVIIFFYKVSISKDDLIH